MFLWLCCDSMLLCDIDMAGLDGVEKVFAQTTPLRGSPTETIRKLVAAGRAVLQNPEKCRLRETAKSDVDGLGALCFAVDAAPRRR